MGPAGAANAGATGDGGATLYPWDRSPDAGPGGERPATAGSLDSADFIIRNELPEALITALY